MHTKSIEPGLMQRILLTRSGIDENKASFTESRGEILMLQCLITIVLYCHSASGSGIDKKES